MHAICYLYTLAIFCLLQLLEGQQEHDKKMEKEFEDTLAALVSSSERRIDELKSTPVEKIREEAKKLIASEILAHEAEIEQCKARCAAVKADMETEYDIVSQRCRSA